MSSEEQISVFNDEYVVNGILKTKQSIENIDIFLEKRHCESKFGNLNKYADAVRNVKSATSFGISLNDLYEFKDGKLTEKKENEQLLAFKTPKNVSTFGRIGDTTRTRKLLKYGENSALPENFYRYTKRGDSGKCFYNLMGEGYLKPTIFLNGGYDYAFSHSNMLSSAEMECYFFVDGLNYTFSDCLNLKEIKLDVLSAHREYIDAMLSGDDIKASGSRVTWSDFKNKYPSLVKTSEAFGVGTVNAINQWNSYARLHGGNFNAYKPISASFNGMVENCPSLEKISFPSFYLSDVIDKNGLSTTFKYNSTFSKHIGLSTDQDVDLVFKDTTIKAYQDLITDTIVEYHDATTGKNETEEFQIVGVFYSDSIPAIPKYYPTKISIGNTVTEIDAYSIYKSVKEITVPNSVSYIGSLAFNDPAYNLSVTFKERTITQVQSMNNYPWGIDNNTGCKIFCTDGTIEF